MISDIKGKLIIKIVLAAYFHTAKDFFKLPIPTIKQLAMGSWQACLEQNYGDFFINILQSLI